MKFLITGSAGFIGYHLAHELLKDGHEVIGVDNLNDYYDPLLKEKRNEILSAQVGYKFKKLDIAEYEDLFTLVNEEKPDQIIHLAAQAGVRYSLVNPWAYERANTLGTMNVFEAAKNSGIKRVLFASSSSVYGSNTKMPFSESDTTDNPISLYAASKKSCELLAKTYNHLYGIETAGFRFFTVYGEMSRPDMAMFIFAKNIIQDKPIRLFNNGKMKRNYTFVSDIVGGIKGAITKKDLKYELYNLGGNESVDLERVVQLLEKGLGKRAKMQLLPMQPGDVEVTEADVSKAATQLGFAPKVGIEEGIERFCKWFLSNKEWALSLRG